MQEEFLKEILRARKGKKKKKKQRRKVDGGNETKRERDHYKFITLFIIYPPPCLGFMGFLSPVIILSLLPLCSISYQHRAGVPWHSGKLHLIIKYSNQRCFLSTLCFYEFPAGPFFVEQCHDCWGYKPAKNQFPPTRAVV